MKVKMKMRTGCKNIFVDGARALKRMRPAPQGRGYRVRKRSNHVTINRR